MEVMIQAHRAPVEGGGFEYLNLRVIGGDENRTQCLGDINAGTWLSRLGESRI
jgi:hypothetical protein